MKVIENAKPVECPDEVRAKWEAAQPDVEEAIGEGEVVTSCNYFSPRPWRNEYDRGSGTEGFTYVTNYRHVYQGIIATHPIPLDPDEYGKEFLAKGGKR